MTTLPCRIAIAVGSLAFLFGIVGHSVAQTEGRATTIPLWPDGPPDDNGLSGDEEVGSCIGNISQPTLTVHLPEAGQGMRSAIVITPGGGYRVVCADTEGTQIANHLVSRGIAAVVLKYRLPNHRHLIPANDARRAIRTVRHRAKDWGINPHRVGVWGFSAGGHLASTVSTTFDPGDATNPDLIERQNSRPDFAVLFYPVISMEEGVTHVGSRSNLLGPDATDEMIQRYSNELQVSGQTPPTFILHAADDPAVPLDNGLRYHRQLVEHGVSARLLVFETGGHGPTAFQNNPSWMPVFEDWLVLQGAIKR